MKIYTFLSFCLAIISLGLLSAMPCQAQSSSEAEYVLIGDIEFQGNKKTKRNYLLRFMESRAGLPFSKEVLAKDLQNIENLQLFSQIRHQVTDSIGLKWIRIELDEKLTLLPIMGFDFTTEQFRFALGGTNYNTFGNGTTVRAKYQYYQRHSFELMMVNPWLGDRWGGSLEANKWSTIEPAYFSEDEAFYNVDKINLAGGAFFNFNLHHQVWGSAGYLKEIYDKNRTESSEDSPGIDYVDFNKYLGKIGHNWNRLNYYLYYLEGFYNRASIEYVITEGIEQHFWKITNDFRWYKRVGREGNWAARLLTGISQNDATPFPAFVHDDYVNLRSVGDRVARGSAEVTFNLEYRHSLWEHELWVIQGVLYSDMSTLRPAGEDWESMTRKVNNRVIGGTGLRLHYNRIYGLILRLDFGVNLDDPYQNGIVVGLGHFF